MSWEFKMENPLSYLLQNLSFFYLDQKFHIDHSIFYLLFPTTLIPLQSTPKDQTIQLVETQNAISTGEQKTKET